MIKKPKQKVHQPHDKVVKRLLSNPKTAHDVLSLYLPKEILSHVDLSQLELQTDSFIDDEHRAHAVDLLYKTTFNKEEGYIYVLIEHQRKGDRWISLRLLKYITLIWDHCRKSSKSNHIPFIYPIVIYNGEEPYSQSMSFIDLIQRNLRKNFLKTSC